MIAILSHLKCFYVFGMELIEISDVESARLRDIILSSSNTPTFCLFDMLSRRDAKEL